LMMDSVGDETEGVGGRARVVRTRGENPVDGVLSLGRVRRARWNRIG